MKKDSEMSRKTTKNATEEVSEGIERRNNGLQKKSVKDRKTK